MSGHSDTQAEPDSFVIAIPTSWPSDAIDLIVESYQHSWVKRLTVDRVESDFDWAAKLGFDDETEATVYIDEPIPELVDLSGRSYEPYAASEVAMLESHENTWRVVMSANQDARNAAMRVCEVMSAFVDAGAFGVFVPMATRLHSPRTVRSLTVDPTKDDMLANCFVNAWHDEGWMRSRGLTAFGLPELETPVDQGLNAAYFRIMDIAANMIGLGRPYPPGAQLDAGPASYRLEIGPKGLEEDEEVPVCGHFGVRSIMPK